MIELKGKYTTAKIFIDDVDQTTISQIYTLLNQESLKNSQIRIMPDCHAGKGCVIGTTMTLMDSVIPNLVGIDIGCGMLAIKLKEHRIDLPAFDSIIRKYIPSGGDVYDSPVAANPELAELRCRGKNAPLRENLAIASLGTLGGGNHFIEVDRDSEGCLWLVIHTGSRHLGIEVCNYYQKSAYKALEQDHYNTNILPKKNAVIERLTQESRQREIPRELDKIAAQYRGWTPSVPFEMAYCTGSLMEDYIYDMRIVQNHAKLNRATIAKRILRYAKLHEVERFDTIHNYIESDSMILRKGAISAQLGERVLIPMNMRDGSLICIGKGNPDWNCSAPHGAGRLFSRSDAKELFSVAEYKKEMESAHVYSSSVCKGTLDECPMAYKSMESIISAIGDTVGIVDRIVPIYNFKAAKAE